ncbi:AI-2E family transporter [Palleronia pelagia]|uniref:Predicted PurR-regulated permease PerM n=1 Tax=Palleronia pelagia TaxID=387096 RepID=A0A1H8KMJ5_9RHOB|nr:AI-2E family transporter [Palleronia pelagia]SEN94037.1 Predicted PurR-regulated permease PerM [Palleronia pelagia]
MALPPVDQIDPDQMSDPSWRIEVLSQLNRIRRALILLAFVAVVVACYFARDVLLPIILGLMLALTLSPIVRTAGRIGVPAPVTAVLLIVTIGVGLSAAGYAASGPVSRWLAEAPEMGRELQLKLRGLTESVEKVKEASEEVEEMAESNGGGERVQKVSIESPGLLDSAVSNAASVGTTFAVTLVLALFLLASGDMFRVKIVEALPSMSDKKRAYRIMMGVEKAISRYLLTITLINAGLGLIIWGLMWASGLDNAYVWGIVAFAFNFLPFIGAMAGVFLVSVFSLLAFPTLGAAITPPLLYLAATSLEGQIITPAILGRRLELNTVSVFVTVVFWGWLWGIAGALMAVPFLVAVKVICDNIDRMKTWGHFLGSSDLSVRNEATPETA